MRCGARLAVAVEKVSEVHFKSAHQAVTLAKYLEKAREHGWNYTVTPHPSAPYSPNNEIIEQTCRKAYREAQEHTRTQDVVFKQGKETVHASYPCYEARVTTHL